jgi:integrase
MLTDPLFLEFCQDRNLSHNSQKAYHNPLKEYAAFYSLSLQELIDEADLEEENHVRAKNRKIIKRLKQYRNHKISQGSAPNTIRDYYSKVKTFYRHYGIEIPYIPPTNLPSNRHEKYSDIPTIEHIRTVLESTNNLKHKAIILLMASSGMATNEVTHLKVKDFIDATSEYHTNNNNNIPDILLELGTQKDIIPIFELIRRKTNYLYYTCCSPEATHSIIRYLKTRPQIGLNDSIFNIKNHSVIQFFSRLNDLNGYPRVGEIRFFHAHGLRKFHATSIEDIGLANTLQGRKSNSIVESYFKKNPKRLRERYLEHLNKLMINKVETFNIKSDEYLRLEKDNQMKEDRLKELEKKDKMREEQMKRVLSELDLKK